MSDTDLTPVDDGTAVSEENIPLPGDDTSNQEDVAKEEIVNEDESNQDDSEYYESEKEFLEKKGLTEHESIDDLIEAYKAKSVPATDPRLAQLEAMLAPHGGIAGVIALGGIPANQPAAAQTVQSQYQLQQSQQNIQTQMGLPENPMMAAIERMLPASNWDDSTKAVMRQLAPLIDASMALYANPLMAQNAALYGGFTDLQSKAKETEYKMLSRKYREQGTADKPNGKFIPRPALDSFIARENQSGRTCSYEQAVDFYRIATPGFDSLPEPPRRGDTPAGNPSRPVRKARLKRPKGKSIAEIRRGLMDGSIDPESLDIATLKRVHEIT